MHFKTELITSGSRCKFTYGRVLMYINPVGDFNISEQAVEFLPRRWSFKDLAANPKKFPIFTPNP
jgi:hypothetical protein